MAKGIDLSELVSKTQQGDKESRERLATHVRHKVIVYVYRLTLDYHLAQDLTQETVLQMIKSLPQLRVGNDTVLWAWIYRTALGKIQHHTRLQGRQRLDARTVVDHEKLTHLVQQGQDTAVVKAQRSELLNAITMSLNTLKFRYRNILTLRCYDQLSYAEIAAVTGGTELQARLLFFRAKRALQRKLSHRGIKRDTLLSALTLFGTLTALRTQGASAGTIVTSEALKTGALAGAIGIVTTKTVLTGTAVLALGLAVAPLDRSPARTNKATPSNYLVTVPDSVNTDRVFPSWILETHDPDNSGWFGLFTQGGNAFVRRVPLTPEMLISRRWEGCCLLIPEGHWMTFGMPRMIVNARVGGIDISCFCLNSGPDPSIFLTNGKTQEIQLQNIQIHHIDERRRRLDIDLAGLQVPFRPTAVRIEGHGPASGDHTALYRLLVRIAPPEGMD